MICFLNICYLILSSYRKKRLFLDLNMNFPRKRTCRLYCPTYLNKYPKISCIYIQKLASENHWRKMSWTVLSKTFHSWYGMGIKKHRLQIQVCCIILQCIFYQKWFILWEAQTNASQHYLEKFFNFYISRNFIPSISVVVISVGFVFHNLAFPTLSNIRTPSDRLAES